MEIKKLQSFKDLSVWQKSSDLAALVYKITQRFPQSELYGLTNQMRRAAISISSNIAEGFKRNHKKEKLQFYNVAYSSNAELESQIEISYKLNYLVEQDYQKLLSLTIEVAKMIDGLIKSIHKSFLNPKFYILFPFIFLYSIFYILTPLSLSAAVLYLEPSEGQYQIEDTFIVEVRIDTEEECINVVEANLSYDKDILQAVDFSYGSSIITLWVKPPEINQESGRISFSGGIPGGYCGKMLGDPGPTHILGKIVLQASNKGEAKVNFLDSSQVLLNDGLGTPAKLTTKDATFTILPEKEETLKNEWQTELLKDTFPPESFKIEIHQNPEIFDGKYFIIFFTTDKQTGIDHYEVKEGRKEWKTAQSPYLLENQKLTGKIKVKAVDKAGNERVAVIEPRYPLRWYEYPIIWVIIILGIIIGYILWRIKRKKSFSA